MGVSRQHCLVYGYSFEGRFPWDKMHRMVDEGEMREEKLDFLFGRAHRMNSEESEFYIFQDPRGSSYVIAGIVQMITDDARWNGVQSIEPTVPEIPPEEKVEEMEQSIDEYFDEDFVQKKTEEPEHIIFTHNS